VTWQHFVQEEGKGVAAAAALSAVGAINPLASLLALVRAPWRPRWVIAEQQAVAVQRLGGAALGATPLFE
jgi:hypothetical protein